MYVFVSREFTENVWSRFIKCFKTLVFNVCKLPVVNRCTYIWPITPDWLWKLSHLGIDGEAYVKIVLCRYDDYFGYSYYTRMCSDTEQIQIKLSSSSNNIQKRVNFRLSL